MPAQSTDPPAEEPGDGQPRTAPETPEEHDLLDEDSLLEDQPYASLEEEIVTYGEAEQEDLEGPDAW